MPPRHEPPSNFDFASHLRKRPPKNVVRCSECGCEWMELVEVYQFHDSHTIILGQKPQTAAGPFVVFRCPKCQEIFEPFVQGGARDSQREDYDQFINHLQKDFKKPDGENL